ncbi:unnamed protein product [Prorocentrum cordatum]|uniref:Transmembrane protein 231 n=1 Tax=Prorocentrum cordatum TaxID=2364126 RepID=A0ABN9VYH1_9DINO|nr:unnamed protein product [Polarella glacialis]
MQRRSKLDAFPNWSWSSPFLPFTLVLTEVLAGAARQNRERFEEHQRQVLIDVVWRSLPLIFLFFSVILLFVVLGVCFYRGRLALGTGGDVRRRVAELAGRHLEPHARPHPAAERE